jgi:hypothetical protein
MNGEVRMKTFLQGSAALLLGCGLLASAADPPLTILPDPVYVRLIEPTLKGVQAALAGDPSRRSAEKARVALLMLAEYSQQNFDGNDAALRATLRDAALDIAVLVKDNKYADALKRVEGLPSLAPDPKAKREKVKLVGSQVQVDELMGQFRSAKVGGWGIEGELDRLATVKDNSLRAADLTDDLRLLAYRTAVTAELVREHVPAEKAKEWRGLAENMKKSALELAAAANSKDAKAGYSALMRLHTSCNDCHKEFRN